ncbi:hypothetical protein Pmani_019670 [Petrolisthes manimaculis]|uniref:Uncharacterized protein n=1 Tax=Petrolisthes manimaculis TaxID=1843537 RepID=A0AAE1U7E4_9EUCA|nr:hypothetical protein Pmani_019670 [Petrolisthes manimaculis]
MAGSLTDWLTGLLTGWLASPPPTLVPLHHLFQPTYPCTSLPPHLPTFLPPHLPTFPPCSFSQTPAQFSADQISICNPSKFSVYSLLWNIKQSKQRSASEASRDGALFNRVCPCAQPGQGSTRLRPGFQKRSGREIRAAGGTLEAASGSRQVKRRESGGNLPWVRASTLIGPTRSTG